MHGIVAAAFHAGHLIRGYFCHHLRRLRVLGLFFKNPHSRMTVQALAIVEGSVEFYIRGRWGLPEILHVKVAQAAKFRMHSAEHRVIGMAGITGAIARDQIVLKMPGRYVAGIIDMQALPEVMHHVAGKAELRTLGAFHVLGKSQPCRQHWRDE